MNGKPSIVLCHGIWADGSSFSKLIPTLRAEGYETITAQYGLDTNEGDVEATLHTLGRVSSPAILVGHSYGGSVITAAGTDDRVAGLVYISALAPDEDETTQSQLEKFPATDVLGFVEPADGRLWLRPEGVECFAGDLSPAEKEVVRATQFLRRLTCSAGTESGTPTEGCERDARALVRSAPRDRLGAMGSSAGEVRPGCRFWGGSFVT